MTVTHTGRRNRTAEALAEDTEEWFANLGKKISEKLDDLAAEGRTNRFNGAARYASSKAQRIGAELKWLVHKAVCGMLWVVAAGMGFIALLTMNPLFLIPCAGVLGCTWLYKRTWKRHNAHIHEMRKGSAI